MTRLHPEERPSKARVARDLALWQELAGEPVVLDLSTAGFRLREKLRSAIAEQDTQQQYKRPRVRSRAPTSAVDRSAERGSENLYPGTQVDIMSDQMTQDLLRTLVHAGLGRDIIFRWNRCTLMAPFSRPSSVTLRMSRSVELFSDGEFLFRLWVHVGLEKVMESIFDWQSPDLSAPVGSIEMEKILQDGIADLAQGLKQGIEAFVEHLPADEGVG